MFVGDIFGFEEVEDGVCGILEEFFVGDYIFFFEVFEFKEDGVKFFKKVFWEIGYIGHIFNRVLVLIIFFRGFFLERQGVILRDFLCFTRG